MGGWGAALLGLKHHRLFGAVGIFSAPFAISRLSMPESEMIEKTQQRFGPPNSAARRERDPNTLSLETPVELLPRLVIACGGEDDFVRQSRLFAERLRGRDARYEYHELAGLGHSFEVWDQEIPAFIVGCGGIAATAVTVPLSAQGETCRNEIARSSGLFWRGLVAVLLLPGMVAFAVPVVAWRDRSRARVWLLCERAVAARDRAKSSLVHGQARASLTRSGATPARALGDRAAVSGTEGRTRSRPFRGTHPARTAAPRRAHRPRRTPGSNANATTGPRAYPP